MPVTINTGKVKYKDSNDQFQTLDAVGGIADVQVNGTSVVTDGVANVPIGSDSNVGVVKTSETYGLKISTSGNLSIATPTDSAIRAGISIKPIVPTIQHTSVFYGLAKAAGDITQAEIPGNIGQYTESAKSAIHTMLNGSVSVSGTTPTITALSGVRYVCGEVSTLNITLPASGIVDVIFESGSTPTVLTITPPTGVTVKWANGFDPTALEADTTYEINILDGLGVAGKWT